MFYVILFFKVRHTPSSDQPTYLWYNIFFLNIHSIPIPISWTWKQVLKRGVKLNRLYSKNGTNWSIKFPLLPVYIYRLKINFFTLLQKIPQIILPQFHKLQGSPKVPFITCISLLDKDVKWMHLAASCPQHYPLQKSRRNNWINRDQCSHHVKPMLLKDALPAGFIQGHHMYKWEYR